MSIEDNLNKNKGGFIMSNETKIFKPLSEVSALNGKKKDREIIYTYLDFQFNLHKIGDNAEGKPMYRVQPVNFDCKLLKNPKAKVNAAKGFVNLESLNLKEDLKTIFDNILALKKKKDLARKAYEKSLKK
ncbi:MAG: hypothetical protein ACRDD2_11355 [Sarcina sp.]